MSPTVELSLGALTLDDTLKDENRKRVRRSQNHDDEKRTTRRSNCLTIKLTLHHIHLNNNWKSMQQEQV